MSLLPALALNNRGGINIPLPGLLPPHTVAETMIDDGFYNGFPFPNIFKSGFEWSAYKKAAGHAPKGPMTLARRGQTSWTEHQIHVDGIPIECAALSTGMLSSGRVVIAYQDDEAYTSIKFAYSDDEGDSFTSAGTINFGAGYSSSPSPVGMIIMPSGKVKCCYYKGSLTIDEATVGFIDSTDEGVSWSVSNNIFVTNGTGFGDDLGYETGVTLLENTGVDSTCRLISLTRHATTGGVYIHYKSSDGGDTWTTDTTTIDNPGGYSRHYQYSWFGNQQPCDLMVYNGRLVMLVGERNTTVPLYRVGYITASIDDAFDNVHSGWSSITWLAGGESSYNGGEIDFGYPRLFVDYYGKLWCQFYDPSLLPRDPMLTEDRVLIKQIEVTGLN